MIKSKNQKNLAKTFEEIEDLKYTYICIYIHIKSLKSKISKNLTNKIVLESRFTYNIKISEESDGK